MCAESQPSNSSGADPERGDLAAGPSDGSGWTSQHGLELRRRADGRVEIRDSDPTRMLLTIGFVLVLLGGAGVQFHSALPGWLAWVSLLPLCLGGLLFGAWAIASASEVETRGVITHVRKVTLRPAQGAGYRRAADGATLHAAGRSWPLAELRRIEVGRRDEANHFLYLVMSDEVLVLARHESDGAKVEALADAVAELFEARRVADIREDKDWESQSWAPLLLVAVPTLAWLSGMFLAGRELWENDGFVPPWAVALALVLLPVLWRAIIMHQTRRMLLPLAREHARNRFGIEPRG